MKFRNRPEQTNFTVKQNRIKIFSFIVFFDATATGTATTTATAATAATIEII